MLKNKGDEKVARKAVRTIDALFFFLTSKSPLAQLCNISRAIWGTCVISISVNSYKFQYPQIKLFLNQVCPQFTLLSAAGFAVSTSVE